ncbi:hypothetical protein BBI00_04860 [Chryseobacterium arthrosphaerae]|uniref:Uncharacterized protein n=1 Tax=Chryseobacterium arthrosphaerae TaxID=651561 RepID=A0A1B8ZQ74_9FLAO|nr:hypothetical protein BBI00_04860 [Chryseobacterium arthrosphaerae]
MLNEIFSQAGASILPVPKIISKIRFISILQKIILAALRVNNTLRNSKVLLFHTDTSETLASIEGKNTV